MTAAIVSSAEFPVNRDDPAAVVRFFCAKEGITPAEYAADLDGYDGPHAEQVALVRQTALQLSIEAQRVTLTRFESHPAVVLAHSRFARSDSRRRKPCKVCARMGRKCGRHARKGGAA